MEKKCIGCGAYLQTENEKAIGYVKSTDMDYCVRCFKLIHYDQHIDENIELDNDDLISDLASIDGQYVWVIDLFDLESSLNSVLADFFKSHYCHIILNKCDLLPKTINYNKLANYLLKRLKEIDVKTLSIMTRGIDNDFVEAFDSQLDITQPIIITGLANVGKSTIINHLLGKKIVTTNRFPATTININEIVDEKYHIYDTVGIINTGSVQMYLTTAQLKKVLPVKTVRPTVFQLHQPQSYCIEGLAKVEIQTSKEITAVFYLSNQLEIHRTSASNDYFHKHFDELAIKTEGCTVSDLKKHSFTNEGKTDYFISGLGFITITGHNVKVIIETDKRIKVMKREAMI